MRPQTWESRQELDDSQWSEPGDLVEAVLNEAKRQVTRDVVAGVFDKIHRRLLIGPIRVRTYDLKEHVLGLGHAGGIRPFGLSDVRSQFRNETPEVATLHNVVESNRHYALVQYNFDQTDRLVLTNTYTVPEGIDLSRLHRVQFPVRRDDTWHELWITVQVADTQWRSSRAYPLGTFEVATAAFQPPGPDDTSNKIKTYIRLKADPDAPSVTLADNQIRVSLEFRKVTAAGAWRNKLRYNYDKVMDHIPFWQYLKVSLFLVIANISLTVVFSSLVAYAFARLNWPGREFCFVLMLATMMIPFQVIMIPQFLIWKHLGAYNTLTPLWLGAAFGNAFFIFLLRQFMKGIPRDLEDAARLDGCGFLRIYWHIILPLIKPSLAAIAIFTFLGTWNNFMGPLIYIVDQRLYPLSFGLYAFSVQVGSNPSLTMACSLLMTMPVIVIFFFAQKYFIGGITMTGMKQ